MIIIGEQVARARAELRLSPYEVAARMRRHGLRGTNATFVMIAERGLLDDVPDRWVLVLAQALGTDLGALTGRTHLRVL